jgi:protein-S-isoprenylcysteine O-methyltransferase Ste14
LLATGQALAFGSWPALVTVLAGIVPTFAWRARAEEKLLSRTFGERYAVYRQRTKMIIVAPKGSPQSADRVLTKDK